MRRQRVLFPLDATPAFLKFWDRYDYKIAKQDAIKAWHQIQLTETEQQTLEAALAWQLPLWEAQGYGKPYPATYLRGRRWEDEQPTAVTRRAVNPKTQRLIESSREFLSHDHCR